MERIFIILGPTSTGKTSLALKLCKKFNGEIISADSRQVVKYMDIGTGKIPACHPKPPVILSPSEESSEAFPSIPSVMLNLVLNLFHGSFQHLFPQSFRVTTRNLAQRPHVLDGINVWGYDLINPNDYFSGYDYAKFALIKSKQILKQGKTVFIVGGTGFYIDLVTNRIKPALIEPNFELRKKLSGMSLIQLQDVLRKLNPLKFENIDKNGAFCEQNNPTRLIRAIEVEKGPTSKERNEPLPYLENIKFMYLGLTASREILYNNADNWLDIIWKNGLEAEVSGLLKSPYSQSPKLKGLIYGDAVTYLKGGISKEEAITKSKFAIHAYIRRQLTWFKKNADITWFDITRDNLSENIYNFVSG